MKRISARTPVRRVVTLTVGWAIVMLGIAGLFLPVLQGVALILLGLYVLSRESLTARRLLRGIRRRYPRLDAKMVAARERFSGWLVRFKRPRADDPGAGE